MERVIGENIKELLWLALFKEAGFCNKASHRLQENYP